MGMFLHKLAADEDATVEIAHLGGLHCPPSELQAVVGQVKARRPC